MLHSLNHQTYTLQVLFAQVDLDGKQLASLFQGFCSFGLQGTHSQAFVADSRRVAAKICSADLQHE